MRRLVICAALFAGGCALLPEDMRPQTPTWARPTVTQTTPAAPSLALPEQGDLAARHTAFRGLIETRYQAGTSAATARTDLSGQGFECGAADTTGAFACERLVSDPAVVAPEVCAWVYRVSVTGDGSQTGEVRRRCTSSGDPAQLR
jgi:hypothetical protein